jgi:hypothetical protein
LAETSRQITHRFAPFLQHSFYKLSIEKLLYNNSPPEKSTFFFLPIIKIIKVIIIITIIISTITPTMTNPFSYISTAATCGQLKNLKGNS